MENVNFRTSEQTDKLDMALAQMQTELKPAIKDKQNPHFRSEYLTLAGAVESAREALSKYKISVTQWPIHSEDGRVHLITRVTHAGQWMQAHFSIPVTKQDAQGYGSATTYIRRFAFMAALGIAPEDDDAEAAQARASQNQTINGPVVGPKPKPTPQPTPKVASTNPVDPYLFPSGPHKGKQPSQLSEIEIDLYLDDLKAKLKEANKPIEKTSPEFQLAFKILTAEQEKRQASSFEEFKS